MSDERIITVAVVTSGEKGDGPQLRELVEQSRSNGMEVDTVIGDTAYSGIENLRLAENEEDGFSLISKLHHQNRRTKQANGVSENTGI